MERVLKTAGLISDAVVRFAFGLVFVIVTAYTIVQALLMTEHLFAPAPLYEIVLGAVLVVGTTAMVIFLGVWGAGEVIFGLKPEG